MIDYSFFGGVVKIESLWVVVAGWEEYDDWMRMWIELILLDL